MEEVDACMFEETSDNTDYAYVLTDSRYAGTHTACIPYDQVNFDSRRGCFIQRARDIYIFQCIHLELNQPGRMFRVKRLFTFDFLQQ